MRKLFVIFVSFLLVALTLMQRGSLSTTGTSPDVYQGGIEGVSVDSKENIAIVGQDVSDTTLGVEPNNIVAPIGTVFFVNITVTNVTDLFHYGVNLRYDPNVIQNPNRTADAILVDTWFDPGYPQSEGWHVAGSISCSVESTLSGEGVNGSGTIVMIRFMVVGYGSTSIVFDETWWTEGLWDSNGTEIPHTTRNATFATTPYQGDLILSGNNVTTIEGGFDINGSIIVEDNATLRLIDAYLNFTQTKNLQYNITLRNPSNGIPRLLAHNSTITSAFDIVAYLKEESIATIDNSTISCYLIAYDYSVLSISNSSYVRTQYAYDSSIINVYNSTIVEWHNYNYGGGSVQVQVYGSEVNDLLIGPTTIDCTISNLEAGPISYWSFLANCSVSILPGGFAPNVTLTNTKVNGWRFGCYGNSNVTILNSTIGTIFATGSSIIYMKSTTCSIVTVQASSVLLITDSSTTMLEIGVPSWLLNSTYTTLYFHDAGKVHVSWYLDVHVVDSIGQDVPSATVTATYPNATVAESKLTDTNGWARLTLMEKMINATGDYPVGNYAFEATYGIYSDETTVNMTENKQIVLTLEDFIIPEFPSFLILPLFMLATLLAIIVYRRKHTG